MFPFVEAVRAYLAIPASSAPSERVFSIAGFIFNKRRQRMAADKLSSLVFIHDNCQDTDAVEAVYERAKEEYLKKKEQEEATTNAQKWYIWRNWCISALLFLI